MEKYMVFKPQTFHEVPPQSELDNPTDALLEAEVAGYLARAAQIDATRVSVTARGDTITLSGVVGSRFEADAAVETASRVAGVKMVDNRLSVEEAP
jgi:osmotically-inducible protein OsmY